MSKDLVVVGGAGGTTARLDDLTRAAAILRVAADHLTGVGAAARYCAREVVAASAGPEALALQQRAYEGTIWIDAGAGGASRVAEEINSGPFQLT